MSEKPFNTKDVTDEEEAGQQAPAVDDGNSWWGKAKEGLASVSNAVSGKQQLGTVTDSPSNRADEPVDFSALSQSTGIDPKVLAHLSSIMTQNNRMTDPHYMRANQLNSAQTPGLLPQALAGVGQSLAQLSTFGGKVADTSPMQRYADLIQKAQGAQQKQGLDSQQNALAQNNSDFKNIAGLGDMQLKQRMGAEKNTSDQISNALRGDNAKEVAGIRADAAKAKGDAVGARGDRKFDLSKLADFSKVTNEGKAASGSSFGRAANTIRSANQLLVLGDRIKSGKVTATPNVVHEASIAYANLIGGKAAALANIQAIVPDTARSSIASGIQWMFNNPTNAGADKFLKEMFNTANGEKARAQTDINGFQRDLMPGYDWLEKSPHAGAGYKQIRDKILNFSAAPDDEFGVGSEGAPAAAPSPAYKDGDIRPDPTNPGKQRIRQGGQWVPYASPGGGK